MFIPIILLTLPPAVMSEQIKESPVLSRTYVRQEAEDKGWTGNQWSCLDELVWRESKWKINADNPNSSAYGLFQMLKTPEDTEIKEQTERGLRYIEHRYNEPCSALRHHNRKNWY
jgi:resuscitation-promoting factor RpfB